MKFIETPNAPLPGGHYSQATISNGLIFVSGQLPIVPGTKEKVLGDIEDQARRALENVKAIVEAAGSSLDKIVKVNVYLADGDDWGIVNQVYSGFFGSHKPARAIVPVKTLHYGFKIEVEAVAEL